MSLSINVIVIECHWLVISVDFILVLISVDFPLELILVDFILKPSGREPVTRKATHQVGQQRKSWTQTYSYACWPC